MFISKQTKIGLKITVASMIECTRFLLNSGMKYVLTEKFSQDSLELYFGLQRACGHRSDNPTLTQFGYNDNAIRIKGTLSTPNELYKGIPKVHERIENTHGTTLMMRNCQNERKICNF